MSLDKPIDKFLEDQKNKNTLSKTRRDVSLNRQTKTALRSDKLNFIGLPILQFASFGIFKRAVPYLIKKCLLSFAPVMIFDW